MDLKQKAANAWEAREARKTTVAASKQGNTVLVFTVVTIIFLPLSFMSSFFAIGIAAFPRDPGSGEINWPLGTVTGLLFGISLSVSIPLIIFALNMECFSTAYREIRHNYLARIGIKSIAYLPPLAPSEDPGSYRKRWTEMLHKSRHEYMKDDDKAFGPDDILLPRKPLRATNLALSFPSTASPHTLIGTSQDDVENPP
ncbi:hypothetical protein BKA66DRAFT_242645 [Pyrenochaeta sp. MPI-SDFR-AT-0127]|nr:hypothetical protein BKA66DRAFT_242645 [Pyrenochaeta sp. MPI-SDFR-AT-0127]